VVVEVRGHLNLADRLMDLKIGLHQPRLNVGQLLLNVIYDDRAFKKAIYNKDPKFGLNLKRKFDP
jgi:hypothetical protein